MTKPKKTRYGVKFQGMTMKQYAAKKGIPYPTFQARVMSGKYPWPPESEEEGDRQWESRKDAFQQSKKLTGNRRQELLKAVLSGKKKVKPPTPLAALEERLDALGGKTNGSGGGSGNGTNTHFTPPLLSLPASQEITAFVSTHSLEDIQKLMQAYKMQNARLALEKLQGELVDAHQIEGEVEQRFRADAEALLNWPASISADIAAELGVDERTTHSVLDKYVRRYMRERSMEGRLASTSSSSMPAN